MGIFEDYPVGSCTIRGDTVYFAVIDVTERGGNRIVRRPRPYRNGSKLDDTGSKEKEWDVSIVFNNDLEEDDIPTDRPQYPNSINVLIDSFDLHETGTFTLPNRGAIRGRVETYERTEKAESRDTAYMTFHLVADNEDNVDAQSFTTPRVGSTARQIVEETVFSCESLGGISQFLADLEDAADKLQDAMAAPGEAVQDIDQKAARVVRLCDNVERQFTVSGQLGRDLLTDPDSWATVRQLRVLKDTSARAVDQKSALGKVISITFTTTRSLFDIAAEVAQDPGQLLDLNTQLENALSIPAGTVVRVFED